MSPKDAVQEFLDELFDDKLEDFPDGNNINIKEIHHCGMRLDHQGLVHGTKIHRVWIQPLKHGQGSSRGISKSSTKAYVARVHVENGCTPAQVREGLMMSATNGRKVVDIKIGVPLAFAPGQETEKEAEDEDEEMKKPVGKKPVGKGKKK